MTYPLILERHYWHLHQENPEVQKQANLGNLPKKIFHVRGGNEKRTPNDKQGITQITHIDLCHGSNEEMTRLRHRHKHNTILCPTLRSIKPRLNRSEFLQKLKYTRRKN